MRRFFLIAICFFFGFGFAAAVEFYQVEDYALQALNGFRANPLSYEGALGVDDSAVRGAWGEYYYLLERGLPLFRPDEKLNQAARDKITDMVQKSYFSVISPEGIGPDELVEQHGVSSLISGVSIAYVAFEHLIPAERALDYMLDLLKKKSLLMQNRTSSSLLFPVYTHVGVALASVGLDTGYGRLNVYLLCLVFASEPDGWEGSVFAVGRVEGKCDFAYRGSNSEVYHPLVFPDGSYYLPLRPGLGFIVFESNRSSFFFPIGSPARVDLFLDSSGSCRVEVKKLSR